MSKPNYKELNKPDLQDIARERKLSGYSTLNKPELIDLLEESDQEQVDDYAEGLKEDNTKEELLEQAGKKELSGQKSKNKDEIAHALASHIIEEESKAQLRQEKSVQPVDDRKLGLSTVSESVAWESGSKEKIIPVYAPEIKRVGLTRVIHTDEAAQDSYDPFTVESADVRAGVFRERLDKENVRDKEVLANERKRQRLWNED